MSATGGLRERKKVATRRAISDAALDLAIERGPMAITVEDIAAAAGVSPRTVFNYFPSKEAAILGFDPDNRQELVDKLVERPLTESPLEALRNTMPTPGSDQVESWRARSRLTAEHPQLQSAFIAGFGRLEDDLTAAMAARLGLDPVHDQYPRLVVMVGFVAMRVAVNGVADQLDVDAVTAAMDRAFEVVAAGLPAPDANAPVLPLASSSSSHPPSAASRR